MSPHMLEPEVVAPLPPKKDVLLNVRTGKVRPFGGGKLRSAIKKHPRQGRVQVTELGLVGDEQQYALHGEVDKALHTEINNSPSVGFGENLSFSGLNEGNVCIGDKFRLGAEVVVQVSEPRQPCYKLNHRFEYKKMSRLVQDTGMAGWSFRVLKPGFIQEGDELVFVERMYPQWSLNRVQDFLYREVDNMEANEELGGMPEIGGEISKLFRNRVEKGVEDMSNRLDGIPGKNRLHLAWRRYRLTEKEMLTPSITRLSSKLDEADAGMSDEESRLGKFHTFEPRVARDDYSRGGSEYLHNLLKFGDVIQASKGYEAPHTAQKKENGKHRRHIFIIGGIGVTAFLPEIQRLWLAGEDIEVHYAVRSRKDVVYSSCLPPEGERTFVYYPMSQLHFEEFGGANTGTGDPFEAEIGATGQILQVPGGKSLLDVLNGAGFDIEPSFL
ncbi:hypothetical protein INS49_007795 [Diaporthe citri]|uniref:uncharacterized protein n=1 Tax=Diaporthe citri TaxID=83186 RepID=UPI001C826105|nr:uncharacterized protein INS49_007795 [Diaporthe citri]KAG6362702.1 hypothetical protein INS49_007795 [Diaporthe citri]